MVLVVGWLHLGFVGVDAALVRTGAGAQTARAGTFRGTVRVQAVPGQALHTPAQHRPVDGGWQKAQAQPGAEPIDEQALPEDSSRQAASVIS